MISYTLQIVGTEWMWIILMVVFFLFGSKKLPEVSRNIGKVMREIQRGRAEIEREFTIATALPPTSNAKTPPNKLKRNFREPIKPVNEENKDKVEISNKKEENTPKKIESINDTKKETKKLSESNEKVKAKKESKEK